MIITSFSETKHIAKKVAKALNASYGEIISKPFPDKESYIKLKENPRGKTFVIVTSFAKEPNERIIETILAASVAKDYKAKKIILVATYLPYMRQDSHFNDYEANSASHIIKTLSEYFDKIIAIDPHLHRIKTLKEITGKASEITTNNLISTYIKKHFKKDFTVVGPDKESFQWARKIASSVNKKAVIMKKIRYSSTEVKIKSKPLGKNIIIVDDIISTGRTILEIIKMAKKQGVEKVAVIGIHGLFIKDSYKLLNKHAQLITTNTVQNRYARIDVSPIIITALRRYK